MAEIQTATNSADLTQRFLYFVQMQMQNVLLCLGLIDHPSAPKGEPDLQAARMFIDQLEMIREKTRGNLNTDEEKFLTGVLSELQLAFVQVSGGRSETPAPHVHDEHCSHGGQESAASESAPESEEIAQIGEPSVPSGEEEGKKRFSKSYGS